MTKQELTVLINEVLDNTGCGCCGSYRLVEKDVKRIHGEIWEEMKKLKRRRQVRS